MSNARKCQICGRVIYFDGICYQCRTRQERERYLSMSAEEVKNTAEKNIYYPPELYRGASPFVRDKLIALLMDPNCENANHLLQCLAMRGDDAVTGAFRTLEKTPLPWRKKLHVAPSFYAERGGWGFDADGNRIELIFYECYAMLPAENSAVRGTTAVGTLRNEKCSVCGCRIVDILTLDGKDERLKFLGIAGKVRVPCCPNCASMSEKTIVRYRIDGDSEFETIRPFADENYIDDEALEAMSSNRLVLTKEPVPPFYSTGGDEVVTIGGMADWVQDWVYEKCPDCGRKMKFMAQIPWAALMDFSEGSLFIEICTECRTICMIHQQT